MIPPSGRQTESCHVCSMLSIIHYKLSLIKRHWICFEMIVKDKTNKISLISTHILVQKPHENTVKIGKM